MQKPEHDIAVGDRAPNFTLPAPDGKFYQFYERTRGNPVVLLFYSKGTSSAWKKIIRSFRRHDDFAALGVDIFAVSFSSPEDNAKLNFPFLVWSDPKGAITAGYFDGAGIPSGRRTDVVAFLLDANQRVLAIQCGTHTKCIDAVHGFYQTLPPPPPARVLEATAPVILIPDLIDRQMCRDLMAMWEHGGHEEGTVTSIVDGKEFQRVHTPIKRRLDHRIMDMSIHETLHWTIGRRVAPEVEKAFQFSGFRFDRFIVTCYDMERGDYFRAHRDNLAPETADRMFALTLNLNTDDYTGGELIFPEYGPHKYRPESGGGVIFSCSLTHEALPVTSGRRFTLLTFLRALPKGK